MIWSGSLWYDAGTGLQIPVDEWSHVAFTVSAGDISVYIDGEPRFVSGGFPNVFAAGAGIFSVGVNWWDIPFAGAVDELYIFGQALTADEIVELANP